MFPTFHREIIQERLVREHLPRDLKKQLELGRALFEETRD